MDSSTPLSTKTLDEELLQLVSQPVTRVPLPIAASMVVIALFAVGSVEPWIWISWLALAISLLLIRWQILSKLPDLGHLSTRYRLNMANLLGALNGFSHGASVIFFPEFSDLERALQTMILCTLCAGAMATTAGYRPMFLAYALPALLPISVMWALIPSEESPWISYSATALILAYVYVLLTLAGDTYKMIENSFELRLRQFKLNHKLKGALEEAEAANRSKTRFLASASHDLRQPIHTLSLFGAALDMQPLDERSREISQHMNTALQALASELDSLLDISKLDANVVEVTPVPVNLKLLLRRLGNEIEPLISDKQLSFSLDCNNEIWIETDEVLIERVLRNLINNAVHYTTSGEIKVSVSFADGLAHLEVQDTGCGISSEEQAHIFEEFYQVSNPERDRAKGLGLGLAIVQRLVKLLDIKLQLTSELGLGSCFMLDIPKANITTPAKTQIINKAHSWRKLIVLVIDDVAAVGLGMKALLESLGCQVLVADSTETAVEAAKKTSPNIVLADFRLRDNDTGIRSINALRAFLPGLPALLISGDTAPSRLQEAQAAEIELLHKPVMVDALKQAIAYACDLNEDVDFDPHTELETRALL